MQILGCYEIIIFVNKCFFFSVWKTEVAKKNPRTGRETKSSQQLPRKSYDPGFRCTEKDDRHPWW